MSEHKKFGKLLKRLLIVCLCFVMALGSAVTIIAASFDGDLNCDNQITAFDAQLLAEYKAGIRKLDPAKVAGLTVRSIMDRILGKVTDAPVIENIAVEKSVEVKTDETGIVTEELFFNEDNVSVDMPVGVKVTGEALTLCVQSVDPDDSQATVTLQESDIVTSLDVHMEGVDSANTVPMLITLENYLPVGLNTGSLKLYHVEDGETIAMKQVEQPVNHDEFSYDPLTGTVVLAMASFSEVALVSDINNSWDGQPATGFAGGSGTEDDPWLISNAGQMAYFRDQVDAGNTYAGEFVKLTNTIELSGVNFDPIGYGYDYDGYMPDGKTFNGTFDGDHHTIKGLYQNGWELGSQYSYSMAGGGLFASAVDATFKNVHISGANIAMECVDMGILVGYSQGNCTYDHIRIYNSKIANYQRATGGVIGEVSPKRGADGKPVSDTNIHTLKDVLIGNNVVVGSLWGDFDASVGGVIGAR